MLQALLWDVDGTLAETERDGHRVAFNKAFAQAGLSWSWGVDRYGELLRVTGGYERLLADFSERDDAPKDESERVSLARHLHALKNQHYTAHVQAGAVALRPGVRSLLQEAHGSGLRLAIVTTTSRGNVEALLEAALGAKDRGLFTTIVAGEDVGQKKPHPEAYELALRRLGLSAAEVLAIEDSLPGAQSATAAGVPVVVARSVYFAQDKIESALAIGPSLSTTSGWSRAAAPTSDRIDLATLQAWHREAHLR